MRPGSGDDAEIWANTLLGMLAFAVCMAGIALAADSTALTLKSGRAVDQKAVGGHCSSCGVVVSVRGLDPAIAQHEFSTIAGGGTEGIAVMLAVLGGRFQIDPAPVHEVEVRMQDGSVRILRTSTLPACEPGNRVRVVKGRIVPA